MSIFKKFFSIFKKSEDARVDEDAEILQLDVPSETEKYIEERDKKRDELEQRAINKSQDNIKVLKALVDLAQNTIYAERFNKIYELVTRIHDRIVTDDSIKISRLTSFHTYKVNEFITVYDKLLDPLRPKEEIAEHLLSEYKIGKEDEEIVEEKKAVKKQADTKYELAKVDIENHIEKKQSQISDKNKTAISEVKILISLALYEYIIEKKKSDSSFYPDIRVNKDVSFNDIKTFDAYIIFLGKNSKITLSTIYISSQKNNNPVLFDMKNNTIYEYDFVNKNNLMIHKLEDEDIINYCKMCL